MSNWLEKYKPQHSSEIIGGKDNVIFIKNFLAQFNKSPEDITRPNLIIKGINGVGKTLITDLVIKESGFEKVVADLSNVSVCRKTKRKKKTEKEINNTNRTIKTFYMTLQNKFISHKGEYNKKNIVLVFDNISNTSNSKEKESIKSIIKLNNKEKQFPIIVIANNKHSKIVTELRKMVTYNFKKNASNGKKENEKFKNEIDINAPSEDDIIKFINKICDSEKLKLIVKKTDDYDIYQEIISHSQYDIRRLVNILEELKTMYPDVDVTMDIFEKYREVSKTKDIDPGIYVSTGELLNNYDGIDKALATYEEERATIPLMVHENYPSNIRQQYPKLSLEQQIDMIRKISESISESDKIDGLIYSNQCWSLQSVHGFYSCVLPSYYINSVPNKLCKAEKYKFTQDYNKTSIKKINNKVIKKAQENQYLKKVSIYDFLYMASILKTLFENKEFEKVAELMKPYGLKLKEIEQIIKIDKINKSKCALTGKQRTLLKELLGVDE
ncbi:factor C large subunit [Megavirus baoshan]|uniref:Putative factor C large subunit n=1 Tax=Megavirus baoshan TaxID=2496520 RepID=A0A3S8UX92_9VIRU|nr:factor C large subunit [Megavirus baoshan]AZL89373.1 factor C large subunit [Megavirus baoshan]